ncbi:MAG: hypothetical protein NZO58_06330 [Gemmataceae bacterium]|nr:hypothetical protein [Gemmataceae bacterium]
MGSSHKLSSWHYLFPPSQRLPLWLKLAYTAFMAVLVPIYWRDYGPTNFLYFCDVALFFTLAGLWLESPLLISAPLVGIFLPQMLWVVDFLVELTGNHLTEMTHYMFDDRRPLFTRMLSFFHFWLPFLLLGLVWRLGYDRRAFALWTVTAWLVMGICYVAMPEPRPQPREAPSLQAPPGTDVPQIEPAAHRQRRQEPVNINYVFGMSDQKPQHFMDPDWYFATLVVGLPIVIYLPTHLLLVWLFGRRPAAPTAGWAAAP